jgi:ankyrin repeat protein
MILMRNRSDIISFMCSCSEGIIHRIESIINKYKKEGQFELFIDYRDENGITPLMLAAKNGRRDAVEYLAGQGASLNQQDYVTSIH